MSLLKFLRKAYLKADLSQSTADPFTALISDSRNEREVIFRGEPLDSNGAVVNFDVSGGGYSSQSTDTPYKLFTPAIRQAYNFSVSLPLPNLWGSTTLGVDASTFNNAQGDLDQYLRLDWLGRTADIYLGQPEPEPFANFTRIFKGTSAGLSWNLDSILLLGRDARFRLRRKLTGTRYRGMGAQIRLNGTTAYASGTVTCPAGSMTIGGWTRPSTDITSTRAIAGWRNGAAAGLRFLSWSGSGQNYLSFAVRNDVGGLFEALYATSISSAVPHHVMGVLDVTNLKVKLTLDGVEVATANVTGTFNTVLTNLTVGKQPDGAALYYPGEVDDVRMYNAALTASQIFSSMSAELLGTETNLTHYWKFNEGAGTTLADSVTVGGVNLTLTNGTWIGSLEGDSALAGVVKPKGFGKRRQIQPKLVDSQRLVYQFMDVPMQAINAIRDKGDVLTFGADVSDIYSATPAAGSYNTCLAKGLFRLGSSPVGTITGDIQGANGGIIGYAQTGADINRKIYVDFGGLDNSIDIDDVAYDRLNVLNSNITGLYYDQDTTLDAAGDEALRSILAWGSPTRTGIMTVGRIDDPRNQVPTVSWTKSNIGQNSNDYYREPLGIRYKEIVIGYQPYHTVLSPSEVAGTVSLSARDDFGKEYRYVSQKIEGASEDASVLEILTSLDSREAALAELNRLVPFLGADLEKVTLRLTTGVLSHFIGTLADLLITQTNANGIEVERFGGLTNYIVVAVNETLGQYGQVDSLQVVLIGVNEE